MYGLLYVLNCIHSPENGQQYPQNEQCPKCDPLLSLHKCGQVTELRELCAAVAMDILDNNDY